MNSTKPLRQLLSHLGQGRSKLFFAVLSSILNKLCDIVPEMLIGISIDAIINREHSMTARITGVTDPFMQIYLIGALTALLWILESVFEYCYQILWRSLGHQLQHSLRVKTYAHLQALDLAYFESKTTGQLLSIINDDVNELEDFLSKGISEIIQLAVNIVVMGGLFLYLSPTLALLTIAPVPVVLLIAYFFQSRLAGLYEGLRNAVASLSSHLASRLLGITTIKSYATQGYEISSLEQESRDYLLASSRAGRFNAAYIPTVRMGILCGFILSLIVGGRLALAGELGISFYSVLVFLTQRFLWPFTTLTSITDMYERAMASMRRISTLLAEQPKILSGNHKFAQAELQGHIVFKDVSFSYPNGKQVFNQLSFDVPAHKTVAFVGGTGSGKSTIIKLLLRFYDVCTGKISLDGMNLNQLDTQALRKTIALVSQDVYLIDGTVAQNIAYGSPDASMEAIITAAKIAEAHGFITQLPAGYDNQVGENGKNLSGGQRQRIAIARAALKNPQFFVFDEATSALDNETEAAVQRSIATLAKGHTMIVIAHRLSTIRHADIIFVMEQGKIIESGNHEALLKLQGTYTRLWNIQTGNA